MSKEVNGSLAPDCAELGLQEFAKRLEDALRDQRTPLANLFAESVLFDGPNRSVRIHVLKSDGNMRPQVGMLVRELCSSTIDYCIPRKQILSAVEYYNATRSMSRVGALRDEANKMFTDLSNSGEGGELLLFILTESILKYPQAISKMSIKTSPRMHFHGLDGVYVSCTAKSNGLRLHYGESKLHSDPGDAIRNAISSIADMLNDEGFLDASRRDYYLLNTLPDLGSKKLEDALIGFLDPKDSRYLAPEVCAVLLAGHSLAGYPTVQLGEQIPQAVLEISSNYLKILESAAKRHKIDMFHIDLFIIPFPDIDLFRSTLLRALGLQC